jgi:hypothetical protein
VNAHEEIRHLLGTYTEQMDAGKFAEVGELFRDATTVDEDAGTATARSAYVVFQGTEELPLQPIITGRYRDSFVRDDSGHWRFSQRMFLVDQAGDLSHHLTYQVTG